MQSRRNFLGLAAGAGAMALSGSPPASAQGASTPRRLIVDSQVHIWRPNSPERPWVPGLPPQLPEPFTIEKLVSAMDDVGVDRAIIVPPSWEGDRIDYALEAAARYPERFAVMGRIPLADPQARDRVATWKQQKGMLGIRLTFLGPAAAVLTNGTADWLWPAAEKAGVPIMFLTGGTLPLFASIAERHPQLQLIVDHMGISSQVVAEKKVPETVAAAVALAKYPNVSVKLAAAPAYSTQPYPFPDMTDYIKRLFDVYGPRRSYWGSDLTNGYTNATYRQRIDHFTKELNFMSEEDKDWVMGRAILARLSWA
ncbi:MAG: amidohydrolase [Beijerinckiaceae bacterium]|nr:amidohydrolase [Beijerinckiaceae bacterium]